MDEWLRQWESALRDIKEHKLPEAEGIRPTRAFLQAIEKIQPAFALHWSNTIGSKAVMSPKADLKQEIPDGFQVAKIFRNQVNFSNTKGVFSAATLQGEEAPADGQNQGQNQEQGQRRQKCFDGRGRHTFDRCYYLNKDLRPEGWQMNPGGAKVVMQGLQ